MIRIGSTVGNYSIVAKLGEGAMATVFLGEHPRIGKRVAIKVIHPDLATSQEMVSRFFTEARAVSQMRHPNIVEIHDFNQTPDGDSYIIMEFLEGETLTQRLQRQGALAPAAAVRIAQQLCAGLGAAHKAGVVHRDLKPDNIFLLRRGPEQDFVKIVDFGLAKLVGPAQQALAQHHTRTGSVLGTAHYMAPEQAEGKTGIDARADIYSVGCIQFQMLTGQLLFPGDGFGEVLVRQIREAPPLLRARNPAVPAALEKVVLHCLAKRPEHRFQSMEEVAAALADPDRFSREIGDDVQKILGPLPGQTGQMPAPDEPPPTIIGGTIPAMIVGSAPPPAAMLETLIATDAKAPPLPEPAPAGTPSSRSPFVGPAAVANLETVIGQPAPPLPSSASQPAEPATVLLRNPDLPTIAPGPRLPLQTPVVLPPYRPPRKFPAAALVGAVLGLLAAGGYFLVSALLRPRVYTLTVTSVPDGAQVLLNGRPAGTTPFILQRREDEPPLALVVRKEGYLDSARALPRLAQNTILPLKLTPRPPPPPAEAPEPPEEGPGPPPAPAEKSPKPARPPEGQKPPAPPTKPQIVPPF